MSKSTGVILAGVALLFVPIAPIAAIFGPLVLIIGLVIVGLALRLFTDW